MPGQVVWIPGILGTSIGVRIGQTPFVRPVWVDVPSLLGGSVVDLQLAADGVSPGPLAGGQVAVVTDIFRPAYGEMSAFLRLVGHPVFDLAWDWRRELLQHAAELWPAIAAWAGGGGVSLLAHSLGGLFARALYGAAQAAGQAGVISRIVTIGTPHFGSLEAARLLYGLPPLYRGLERLCGWTTQAIRGVGPNWLAATVATWPAIYELMPWADSGPLHDYSPAQAALQYSPLAYRQGVPLPNVAWLGAAPALQRSLAALLPPIISIAGTGFRTAWAYNQGPGESSYGEDGYQYTDDGDGYVTVASASPPGGSLFRVAVEHTFQPLHPDVISLVASLLP
jgi:hypothetical protein